MSENEVRLHWPSLFNCDCNGIDDTMPLDTTVLLAVTVLDAYTTEDTHCISLDEVLAIEFDDETDN